MTHGVLYVAYGEAARRECATSLATLRKHNDVPATVISDAPLDGAQHIPFEDADPGARWAKLNADLLTPWERTLYLDADTRVQGDITVAFEMLADGWELVITPSACQGPSLLWHLDAKDREATIAALGPAIVQLQGGVMGFRRCKAVAGLFARWRAEWRRFEGQDQGALLRALYAEPVKVWLLGRPWNGGDLIVHKYGRAKRYPDDHAKGEWKRWKRENPYYLRV